MDVLYRMTVEAVAGQRCHYDRNTTLLFMPEYVLVRSDQVGIHLKGIGLVRKVKTAPPRAESKTILNEVNIDIPPGSFVSIIGGSGAENPPS